MADSRTAVRTISKGEQEGNTGRRKIKYRLLGLGAGLDMPLLFLIFTLMAIGLIMLYSASYAYCLYNFGSSIYFMKRQLMFAAMGIVAMLLISLFDYHQYHKFAWLLFFVASIMLALTILFRGKAIAPLKGGSASRWLNLGFIEIQPSEIAKFAIILLFAHLISQNADKMHTAKYGFWPFIIILGVTAGMIAAERHLSATIIITMLSIILMLIGGTRMRYLLILGGIGLAGVLLLLTVSDQFAYASNRIVGWLDPFGTDLPEGVSTWQIVQSLYAIGSGQLFGMGLGQSRQKFLYLPEPQNDFIFAVVCEELGFVGAVFIIILFALLIWRGVYVSLNARDKFGTMLGLGITFQIGLQTVLNICVVTNTIPNTGISLPFFSYGGTSLLMLLAEMGILLQISRSSNIEKT